MPAHNNLFAAITDAKNRCLTAGQKPHHLVISRAFQKALNEHIESYQYMPVVPVICLVAGYEGEIHGLPYRISNAEGVWCSVIAA